MRFEKLRYFERVMTLGSIRKAALELGISSPALSDQIRRLEEDLDIVLFVRGRQGTAPTEAAQAILPHAQAALAARARLYEAVDQMRRLDRGTLRVGVVTAATGPGFLRTLDLLHEEHPGLGFDIVEAGSHDISQLVESGELDVGIVVALRDRNPGSLRRIEISRSQLSIVVPSTDELASRDFIDAADLTDRALVAHKGRFALMTAIEELKDRIGIGGTYYYADTQRNVLRMVESGMGIAVSSGMDFSGLFAEYGVSLVPLREPYLPSRMDIVMREDQQPSRVVREFVRLYRAQHNV